MEQDIVNRVAPLAKTQKGNTIFKQYHTSYEF